MRAELAERAEREQAAAALTRRLQDAAAHHEARASELQRRHAQHHESKLAEERALQRRLWMDRVVAAHRARRLGVHHRGLRGVGGRGGALAAAWVS